GQPIGVFHASSNGISTGRDVTASSATGYNADDLFNVIGSIPQQYTVGKQVGWIVHRDFITKARKLKDGDGRYMLQPGLADGRPDTLLGYPIYQSEFAPNTFTTGLYVACFGNYNFYR